MLLKFSGRGIPKKISCKYNEKKIWVVILIHDKVAFRAKEIIRDNEPYYIMIKETIHQKNNDLECLCTKQQTLKIYVGKLMELEK